MRTISLYCCTSLIWESVSETILSGKHERADVLSICSRHLLKSPKNKSLFLVTKFRIKANMASPYNQHSSKNCKFNGFLTVWGCQSLLFFSKDQSRKEALVLKIMESVRLNKLQLTPFPLFLVDKWRSIVVGLKYELTIVVSGMIYFFLKLCSIVADELFDYLLMKAWRTWRSYSSWKSLNSKYIAASSQGCSDILLLLFNEHVLH